MFTRRRRRSLSDLLAGRIVRHGDLTDLLNDALLRQDMRWVEDQVAGRRSEI